MLLSVAEGGVKAEAEKRLVVSLGKSPFAYDKDPVVRGRKTCKISKGAAQYLCWPEID